MTIESTNPTKSNVRLTDAVGVTFNLIFWVYFVTLLFLGLYTAYLYL